MKRKNYLIDNKIKKIIKDFKELPSDDLWAKLNFKLHNDNEDKLFYKNSLRAAI